MWPPKRHNAAPSESETRELTELLEEQQVVVAFMEGLKKQRNAKHQRLSLKAAMLKDTLDSLESLHTKGSKLRSDSIPLLDGISKELSGLRAKRDTLQPLFADTTAFLDVFSKLGDAVNLFKSTLEASVSQLKNFFAEVARELSSTELLCAQTADAITSFSRMTSTTQKRIALMQNGALHPLRRLPEELLVQIFDCCAEEEAQSWIECSGSEHQTPKVLTRLASVCSRWRSIAHSHPGLWCRLLAPSIRRYWSFDDYQMAIETSTDHFRHTLQLRQGAKLNLTIPTRFKFPPDIDIKVLELERLNLLNADETWPPIFPSPKRLWLGQPTTRRTLSREIPLSLVSNTSHITSSISLTFASQATNVTHLVLRGQHNSLPITTLLRSLPRLVIFDAKDARISYGPYISPVKRTAHYGNGLGQLDTHSQLRTFGVDGTGLAHLEQAVVEGLRLPDLCLFEIANIDSKHLATNYPSISTHMSPQIAHLGVFGTGHVAVEALRTLIDTFNHLDLLSSHGGATEPALQALYRGPSRDGANGGSNYFLPNSVQKVMICDYHGNGEAICQRLYEMRADAATKGKYVEIIFKDCLNIRPDIRKKCCPSLVVEQRGRAEAGPSSLYAQAH